MSGFEVDGGELPEINFSVGDAVIGNPSMSLLGDVVFVPEPEGFNSLWRESGPIGKALKKWAQDVQKLAKQFAPVDTGRLQESIGIAYGENPDGIYADIGTDVFYAGYQELGTSRNPAHPYLRPALAVVLQQIEGSLGGSVKGISATFSYAGEGDYAGYTESVSLGD
jgi:HK97 gp10 family phage protein